MLLRALKKECQEQKRDEDFNSVQTLWDRRSLHEVLEWKAESAAQGENSAQKRLSEAEPDLERKNGSEDVLKWPCLSLIKNSNL